MIGDDQKRMMIGADDNDECTLMTTLSIDHGVQ